MRLISYIMIALITYLVQAQVFPELFRKGWQPDLFLVWIILISLIKGRKEGLFAALVGGIVRDTVIGNFFGLHLFPYLLVAYAFSTLGQDYYEDQWYSSVVAVLLGTLLDGVGRFIMLYFVYSDAHLWVYISQYMFPHLWSNALLGIGVHYIIWKITAREEYFW